MQDSKLVSIITPVFNGAPFLDAMVKSVWLQTHRKIEHVIVDDGSTDDSLEKLRHLEAQAPISMQVLSSGHRGVAGALNVALDQARGDFISILAHDDVFLPAKIEEQLRHLESNPKAMIAHCEYTGIDASGNPNGLDSTLDFPPAQGEALKQLLELKVDVRSMTVMFRRQFFERTGGYDESYPAEDWQSILRAAAMGPIVHLPMALVLRRSHSENLSRTMHRETRFSPKEFGFEIIGEILPEGLSFDKVCVLHAGVVLRNAISQGSWGKVIDGSMQIGRMFPLSAWRLVRPLAGGLGSLLWHRWLRGLLPRKVAEILTQAKRRLKNRC